MKILSDSCGSCLINFLNVSDDRKASGRLWVQLVSIRIISAYVFMGLVMMSISYSSATPPVELDWCANLSFFKGCSLEFLTKPPTNISHMYQALFFFSIFWGHNKNSLKDKAHCSPPERRDSTFSTQF